MYVIILISIYFMKFGIFDIKTFAMFYLAISCHDRERQSTHSSDRRLLIPLFVPLHCTASCCYPTLLLLISLSSSLFYIYLLRPVVDIFFI